MIDEKGKEYTFKDCRRGNIQDTLAKFLNERIHQPEALTSDQLAEGVLDIVQEMLLCEDLDNKDYFLSRESWITRTMKEVS